MKLVLFADLHLDTPFTWAPPAAARRRRQALRDTLDAIVDLAVAQGADALCCAGDLYEHDRITPDTGEFLRATFARVAPMPVLVAPGNHDWLGPASVYARTQWSPNVHLFTGTSLEPLELADGVTLWGAAHHVPANTPGFLDGGFQVDRGGVNLALFHGSLRSGLAFQEEGKKPHAPFDAEQIPAAGLHHALVGHFHTVTDDPRYTYPGNPDPLTFGETGERGAVVVEVAADGSVTRTRHHVARTELHDVSVDIGGCASAHDIRERVGAAVAHLGGTVRVTLSGEVAPSTEVDLADLHDVAPHLEQLVPRVGAVTVGYDLEALAAQTGTVRGRFVRDVLDAPDLDDDTRRRVLVTGLRALDGRSDLEVA
jgi:DNA repair protein SbcD/Mre11